MKMRSAKQPWQRCYLHSNWKFGRPTSRTTRQAYGHNVEFDGRRKADTFVFWFAVVAAILVAIMEWLR